MQNQKQLSRKEVLWKGGCACFGTATAVVTMESDCWMLSRPVLFHFVLYLFPVFIILNYLMYLVRTNSGLGGVFEFKLNCCKIDF